MSVRLIRGDCREVLPTLDAESVDAVVTDPPYGLHFMGKAWDSFGGALGVDHKTTRERSGSMHAGEYDARRNGEFGGWCQSWARECLRVLKPGAHLVAFGGPRTFHRLTSGIEDAGFEVRDCLSWLFGSGFPKSHNLPGGLGTALKPAWEPIVLARKPLVGTVAANVERFGTGALNIDGCRIGDGGGHRYEGPSTAGAPPVNCYGAGLGAGAVPVDGLGRWPANACLDEAAATELDAAAVGYGRSAGRYVRSEHEPWFGPASIPIDGMNSSQYDDSGGPSRFFYTAKASRSERNKGLVGMPAVETQEYGSIRTDRAGGYDKASLHRNHHPTVKPVDLMRWLVKLITPPGGLVLDPFMGSGTTGIACVLEERAFLGIEREAEYLEIARRRIEHAQGPMFAAVEVS